MMILSPETKASQKAKALSLYRLEFFDSEDRLIFDDIIMAVDASDAGMLAAQTLRSIPDALRVEMLFTREGESFCFKMRKVPLN
jgi:hypothetical protein